MTFLEAINAIEKLVSKLRMKHKDGSEMEPIVAIGKIGHFYGERFDSLLTATEQGQISIEEYYMEMVKIIHSYRRRFE
jgi:hypothetical protein